MEFERSAGGHIDLVQRDDHTGGVAGGQTDAAILYGTVPADSALRVVELGTESRVAAVSRDHTLARRRRLHWSELAEHRLVVNVASGTVEPTMWPAGARPEAAVSCRTYDEWIELVSAGLGFGVLPESARQHPHPGVRYVSIVDAPPVSLLLVLPGRTAHPLTDVLERLAVIGAGRPTRDR